MKEDPVMTTLWAFFFSLLHLSLSMQLFERNIDVNFQNLTTAMWLIIITMTTVGYGDYSPKTNFGRLVGVITAFWGVFFVSLFVVALTNTLEPDESEMRAFILLRRLFTRNELRKSAARMIQTKYLARNEERKPKAEQNTFKVRGLMLDYTQYCRDFRIQNQHLLSMND